MNCVVLQFLREESRKAEIRHEYAEVLRRQAEESKHVDQCPICSPYLQLWPDAKLVQS